QSLLRPLSPQPLRLRVQAVRVCRRTCFRQPIARHAQAALGGQVARTTPIAPPFKGRPLMRVSIAMATFNGARFLQAQLESLARQTYLPSQLVITDDRSEDGTVAIARRFSKSAPFEVVISVNEQRAGVTGNFDSALSHCNGDLVLPCDQDDVWFDGKVETLVDAARGNPSIGCWMVDAALV